MDAIGFHDYNRGHMSIWRLLTTRKRRREVKRLISAYRVVEGGVRIAWLTKYSIAYPLPEFPDRRIHAIVPEPWDAALDRLKRDDPIWNRPEARWEWSWPVQVWRFRGRPANRIKFWYA